MKKTLAQLKRYSPAVLFQTTFVPLAPPPPNSPLGQLYANGASGNASGDLASFISGLFTAAISIGAVLAVLRLGYAGYLYMMAGDAWSNKGKAKEVIGDAVLGLLLLLSVYLILNQINPDILKLNVLQNLPKLPAKTQSTGTGASSQQTNQTTNGFNVISDIGTNPNCGPLGCSAPGLGEDGQ